jgi:hypothetical protein
MSGDRQNRQHESVAYLDNASRRRLLLSERSIRLRCANKTYASFEKAKNGSKTQEYIQDKYATGMRMV